MHIGKCKYTIKYNGDVFEFNTQREIEDFLTNNYDALSAISDLQDIKLSKDFNMINSTFTRLKHEGVKFNKSNKVSEKVNQWGDLDFSTEKATSVTNAIYTLADAENPTKPLFETRQFDIDEFKYNKIEEFKKNNPGYNDKSVNDYSKELNTLFSNWNTLTELGTKFHNVAEIYFNNDISNEDELIKEVKKSNNLSIDEIKSSLIVIKQVEQYLRNLHSHNGSDGSEIRFIAEHPIQITNDQNKTPLSGKIDLMVIDGEGRLHIYDFKTSYKPLEDWDINKREIYDYQLAFYRRMLAAKGYLIDSKTHLGIIPVEFIGVDYNTKQFNEAILDVGNIVNRVQVYDSYKATDTIGESTNNRISSLDWTKGRVSNKVAQHIPIDSIKLDTLPMISERVKKFMEIGFGWNEKLKSSMSVEYFKKDKKNGSNRIIKTTEKAGYNYKFYDEITGHDNVINMDKSDFRYQDPWIYANDDDLDIKIKSYLDKISQSNYTIVERVRETIYKGFHKGNNSKEGDNGFLDFSFISDANVRTFYEKRFDRYGDGTWVLRDDAADSGILIFYQPSTGILDVVSITSEPLDKDQSLKLGKSILGNFVKDRDTAYINKKLLKGNIGSIEAIKALSVINELSGTWDLTSASIGDVFVINPYDRIGYEPFRDRLIYSFNEVVDSVNTVLKDSVQQSLLIKNNIKSEELQFAPYINVTMSRINSIMARDTEVSSKLKKYFGNFTELYYDKKDVVKDLEKLISDLRENATQVVNVNLNQSDPITRIYSYLQKCLLYEKNLMTEIESGVYDKWGFSLGTNMFNGTWTSHPDTQQSKIALRLTNGFNATRQKIAYRFMDESTKVKRITEKYLSDSGYGGLRRMTVGDSFKAYLPLYERDSSGNLTEDFKFKNPYDNSSNLKPYEREYLKEMLDTLNLYRFGVKRGDRLADQKMITGEWFQSPLLKAEIYTKIKEMGFLKAVKAEWKDVWDDMTNWNELVGEDQLNNLEEASTGLFNFSDTISISQDSRQKSIGERGVGSFETDLELTTMSVIYSKIKQAEMSEFLPIANCTLGVLQLMAYENNDHIDNFIDFLQKQIRLTIYNVPPIEAEQKTMYKVTTGFRKFANNALLALNLRSLARESTQGIYNNSMISLINKANKSLGPGLSLKCTPSDVAKAYKMITTDLSGVKGDLTKLELINVLYRISGMSTDDIVEKMSSVSHGLVGFWMKSKGWNWTNSSPDYLNRMTLILSEMIHDGCLDAHYVSEDGRLLYDWKKDKRFSEIAANNRQSRLYATQLSLYKSLLSSFANPDDGSSSYVYDLVEKRISTKPEVELKKHEWRDISGLRPGEELDPLPLAYDYKKMETFKSVNDMIYGHLDKENGFLLKYNLLGTLIFQFKSYTTSKKDQYFLTGGFYNRGDYQHVRDKNNNPIYLKYEENPDTGAMELVQTTDFTDTPFIDWTGHYMEGIASSWSNVIKAAKDGTFAELWANDPVARYNIVKSTSDMSLWVLTMIFSTLIFAELDDRDVKLDPFTELLSTAFISAVDDNFVVNAFSSVFLDLNPPSFAYMMSLSKNLQKLIMQPGYGSAKFAVNSFGLARPFKTTVYENNINF